MLLNILGGGLMNISVIGTGYIGLVAACCLANSGHQVFSVDKDLDKIEKLNRGVIPIYEEGLETLLNKAQQSGKITFSSEIGPALINTDMVIIAVGTPATADGRVDMSYVNDVAESIIDLAAYPLTVIMKSTVPPGTGKLLCKRFFSRAKVPISYSSNPEFLREGKAVWDWYNTDRIVIGTENQETAEKVMELYRDIDAPKICMDITSAEMVKYASNAFLATKISFINEIANLCERVGASIDAVAPAIGMDQRIGPHFLQAGLGYGGSCFPKDTTGLDYISSFNGYHFSLLKSVIEVNTNQRVMIVRKITQALDDLHDKKVAVWGLSFKPDTDDVREAPAVDIIKHLIAEGAHVVACDPVAIDQVKGVFTHNRLDFNTNPYETCRESNAILLATEWSQFLNLDWIRIKGLMKSPYLVIDGRNVLDDKTLQNMGFSYIGVGRS